MTDSDPTEEKILDAALERILQLGIRRASLDDIARRAGVNRVTIYRRFTTKDKLVETVLARELMRVLAEVTAAGAAEEGVEAQIEQTMLALIQNIRRHPFVTQLVNAEPEEALAFYTVRGEQLVQAGIVYILDFVRRGQKAGVLQPYDARPVAELLARLSHSLMLTPVGGVDFDDEQQARSFVRDAIVPMLVRGISPPPAAAKTATARKSAARKSVAKKTVAKKSAAAEETATTTKSPVAKKAAATKAAGSRRRQGAAGPS